MILKIKNPKGKYKDENTYMDLTRYILRRDKARSGYIQCFNIEDARNAGEEMYELAKRFKKLRGTKIRHIILSFNSKGEEKMDVDTAGLIGLLACTFYEKDYQMLMAVHDNKKHLHIHIILNTVNINTGKKYPGTREDYYAFQKHLKAVLKPYNLHLETRKDCSCNF